MRAIIVEKDMALRWAPVPDPVPGVDEVLVEIHAAGLNRADLLQRRGKYSPPAGAPEWLGLEVAGVVRRVGPAAEKTCRFRPGEPVCALLAGGGYAEQVALRPELLLPVPAGLSLAEAASLPEVFATAWLNLFIEAGLAAGETVLVHAGASGLGCAAVQLAAAFGARVLATVRNGEKAAAVRALGADLVIDSTRTDPGVLFDECLAQGRPVNVVLDCVGGAALGRHLEKMAPGGRWVLVATLGGERTELDLRAVLTRGLRLIGSTLRGRPLETKARVVRELAGRVWPKIEAGEIRPVVHRVLPVERAEEAHLILERNENVGKVVLAVRPGAG